MNKPSLGFKSPKVTEIEVKCHRARWTHLRTERLKRTATVGRLQKRVCVSVWERWRGSDVFWWGRLAQSCWGTEGSSEWEDAREPTKAGYESNPSGDSQRPAACPEVCQRFRASATRTLTWRSWWEHEDGNEIGIMLMDKNHLMIDTGQDGNLEFTQNWRPNVWEQGSCTAGKEGEGEAGKRRSEKETQVVQISTLRKMDGADAIWGDKEETTHKQKWAKQKLMEYLSVPTQF